MITIYDVAIWAIVFTVPLSLGLIPFATYLFYRYRSLKRKLYTVTLTDGVTGRTCDLVVDDEALDFVLTHLKKQDDYEIKPF